MKTIQLSIIMLLTLHFAWGQIQPIDVAELTLKVGGTKSEELYYGFAAGDQILFQFEEIKGKDLKEIEIIELPSNSKFMDYKTSTITNRKIQVNKTAVYKFSFRNGAIAGRICKVKIQRIPKSSDLISFNTDWKWETLYDTTWVPFQVDSLVGYDTLNYKETIKEVLHEEKVEEMIMDKTERVHSYWNENPSRRYIKVALPSPQKEAYKEETIVAWAYWIGVGEEAKEAYTQNVKAVGNLAEGLASAFASPLAGMAIGALTELSIPKIGEDISYVFMPNIESARAYMAKQAYYQFDKGKGIAAYGKNDYLLDGAFFIGLYNDNQTQGVDVNVKIVVIKEIKTFHDVEYDRQKITPRYITLNKQNMEVATSKVRINAN